MESWIIKLKFLEQIEARRKHRQKRAKEEKRREKRIEAEENRKMGRSSGHSLHLESNVQFPEFGAEYRFRTDSQGTSGGSEFSSLPDVTEGYVSASLESPPSFNGPSFAKVVLFSRR